MTARLMTPFCFASILAAALIAEGALAPFIAPGAERAPPAANEPATYADIYSLETLRGQA